MPLMPDIKKWFDSQIRKYDSTETIIKIDDATNNINDCRYITEEDFYDIPENRRLKRDDVLLTMDGGTSIGKTAVFSFTGNYTIDSHVAILRPHGISAKALAYLLASPLGQLQFKKAKSGASGQTSVTEDDLRRFVFPKSLLTNIEELVKELDTSRERIRIKRKKLEEEENAAWEKFLSGCFQ